MDVRNLSHPIYSYTSSKAAWDPCRTIYLCPPASQAGTLGEAERFAADSGWRDLAEESGSVLVVPLVPKGWESKPNNLFLEIYRETKNLFKTRSGKAIWGRNGRLWCWETMLYLAAYEDGAIFAGNALIRHPGFFAAAALVNGTPNDYTGAEDISDHWLVPDVSLDYNMKNRQIPVHLWVFQKQGAAWAPDYFTGCYGTCDKSEIKMQEWMGEMTVSKTNPAWQTRIFSGDFDSMDLKLNRAILTQCFEHVIRWKNGPDGTLALTDSREAFYASPRFLRRTATVDGRDYDYFVHLPKGRTNQQLAGLPLVFTIHGRGEPAWLFTAKNGWDRLGDETGEFILVSPDSPGNIWFLPRDGMVFPKIVSEMEAEFRIDTSRVYLTGFSNGGMMAREAAVSFPHLFAGVSPWNAPIGNTAAMMKEDSNLMEPRFDQEFSSLLDTFVKSGYEMPCAFVFGDKDPAASAKSDLMIKPMLAANRCIFTEETRKHDCFAVSHKDNRGRTMVTVTVMKNMPHGAVCEESRLTWEFLKNFRRIEGSRQVGFCGDISAEM